MWNMFEGRDSMYGSQKNNEKWRVARGLINKDGGQEKERDGETEEEME